MEFYIYKNNDWNEVQVEINPALVKALDTTNDSFSCILKVTTKKDPIEPMTPFKIIYDDETVQIFWIINDSVSVFSLNPESYKHSLTLVQYRYFLNKHIIRNTVFNQPRRRTEKLYGAVTTQANTLTWDYNAKSPYFVYWNDGNSNAKYWKETIELNNHHKIRGGRYKFDFYITKRVYDHTGPTTTDTFFKVTDIETQLTNGGFLGDPEFTFDKSTFRIVDESNGNYVVMTFTADQIETSIETGYIELTESQIATLNQYLSSHDSVTLSPYLYIHPTLVGQTFLECERLEHIYDYTLLAAGTLQINLELDLYAYSFYDVIDIIRKQYRLTSDAGSKRPVLFNLPTASSTGEDKKLFDLLTTTYPPDTLAFTQATFYEALTKVFNFYDAGFRFDENKMLKIEYYNDLNKNIGTPARNGITLSHSDKNFNSKRISNYQNATEKMRINQMRPRSETLGVPDSNAYALVLPKPIYDITKLEMLIGGSFKIGYDSDILNPSMENDYLDISSQIVSADIWNTLDKQDDAINFQSNNNLYRESTLYFERGKSSINISTKFQYQGLDQYAMQGVKREIFNRFFGISNRYKQYFDYVGLGHDGNIKEWTYPGAVTWKDQIYVIEYQTLLNGKVVTETVVKQYEGEMLVNQGDGLIDLNKMGLSMLAESLKDGEPILTLSYEINDWTHRIKEGDYFIENGYKWVANVINYTLLPNGNQQCSIEFSRNFNALAQRIQSDDEKRLTNISSELAVMSEENYIDYVYIKEYDAETVTEAEEIIIKTDILSTMFAKTFGGTVANEREVDLACVTVPAVSCNETLNLDEGVTVTLNSLTKAQIPLVKYGSGNCICFEMQFDSPINAGNSLMISTGWFGTNKYFSQVTRYTDTFGWKDKIDLSFYQLKDYGKNHSLGPYPLVCDSVVLGFSLVRKVASITNLEFYKKPNEIFALNYEWCFLSNDINDIFVGNKFINENSITKPEKLKGRNFYLSVVSDPYSIMDVKGSGLQKHKLAGLNINIRDSKTIDIGFKLADVAGITTTNWAIVDENNDIYFACNKRSRFTSSSGSYQLTLFTRKSRL